MRSGLSKHVGLPVMKLHGIDMSFGRTEDKLSDHPCCGINSVPLYYSR